MMGRSVLTRLLLLAASGVLPASRALVTYTDLASWEAVATQSGATIDFSVLASTDGSNSAMYSTLSYYPGFLFTSTNSSDYVQVYNAAAYQTWYEWNSDAILRSSVNAGAGGMSVTLATPVTAFAVNMGVNNQSGSTWTSSQMTITLKNGATTLSLPTSTFTTSAHPTLTFFGVVATAGESFDTIIFSPAVNYVFLDDVRAGSYNSSSETPEPGTGLLALCGVAFLLTPG